MAALKTGNHKYTSPNVAKNTSIRKYSVKIRKMRVGASEYMLCRNNTTYIQASESC